MTAKDLGNNGIIIVQHGDFPSDFKEKQKKMFDLIEGMLEKLSDEARKLERKPDDCYMCDIKTIADTVQKEGKFRDMEVGFMEFSSPTIEEAVEKLKSKGHKKIVFVNTPGLMMRSSHSMDDIVEILDKIALKNEDIRLIYAKPGIDFDSMADVFVKRIDNALGKAYNGRLQVPEIPGACDFGVVLIAHGDIPLEYLKGMDFMGKAEEHIEQWSDMVRDWPRTEETDPLYFDTLRLEQKIREKGGYNNFEIGNLEFVSPSLLDSLDKVIQKGAKKVYFLGGTGFMDRSSHTLMDIPEAIEKLKELRPGIELEYVYPDISLVCDDLACMIAKKAYDAMQYGEG